MCLRKQQHHLVSTLMKLANDDSTLIVLTCDELCNVDVGYEKEFVSKMAVAGFVSAKVFSAEISWVKEAEVDGSGNTLYTASVTVAGLGFEDECFQPTSASADIRPVRVSSSRQHLTVFYRPDAFARITHQCSVCKQDVFTLLRGLHECRAPS